jgi:hypothetical protein
MITKKVAGRAPSRAMPSFAPKFSGVNSRINSSGNRVQQ